jgi:ribonuclease HI
MQTKPGSSGEEVVWADETVYDKGNLSVDEAAYLAVHLGLKYCVDQGLHDTSICICSDNATVLKQLRDDKHEGMDATSVEAIAAKQQSVLIFLHSVAEERNRISYCLLTPTANKDATTIANRAIDAKLKPLGTQQAADEAVDYDDEDALVGDDEALARSMLRAYAHDPALLSLKEMKDGWGGCLAFMLAHGLKPWNAEDVEEALTKSRELKAGPVTLANAEAEEDEEADMPPLEHLEPLGDVTDEAAADMPALEPLEEVPLSMRSMR